MQTGGGGLALQQQQPQHRLMPSALIRSCRQQLAAAACSRQPLQSAAAFSSLQHHQPQAWCSMQQQHQQQLGSSSSRAAHLGAGVPAMHRGGGVNHHQRCAAAAGDRSSSLAGQAAELTALLDAVYRFTRPHTMAGTFVSIVSVSLLALGGLGGGGSASSGAAASAAAASALPDAGLMMSVLSGPALAGILTALVPALLMNVAIVGINQIYDVEIDKVNKPYLPLASGELSMAQGVGIVVVCAALSVALGVWSGSPALLATLVGSLVLGVLYSTELPFMRWKRSPWLAALCILAVRAVMVQLGFFLHMRHALGLPAFAPTAAAAAAGAGAASSSSVSSLAASLAAQRPLCFTVAFMLLFSVVIALFKDLPDIKGDTAAGVRTFSVRHGPSVVFTACIALLLAAYAAGIVFGLTSPVPWSRLPVALGHAALGGLLLSRAARVDPSRKSDLTDCYMFVWKLFYSQYLLIPFLR